MNRGRPRKKDLVKNKTISISVTPLQLQILDIMSVEENCSRSELIRAFIDKNAKDDFGITGGVNKHASPNQGFVLRKSGLKACNPYIMSGMCQNSVCQAKYAKERALGGLLDV